MVDLLPQEPRALGGFGSTAARRAAVRSRLAFGETHPAGDLTTAPAWARTRSRTMLLRRLLRGRLQTLATKQQRQYEDVGLQSSLLCSPNRRGLSARLSPETRCRQRSGRLGKGCSQHDERAG